MLKPRKPGDPRQPGAKKPGSDTAKSEMTPEPGLFSQWMKPKPVEKVRLGASGKAERVVQSAETKSAAKASGASSAAADARKTVAPKRKRMAITVGPVTILVALAAFLVVGAWGLFATSTLMFGDKLSARLIAQQSDMQFAYEQKLIVFRAQLDRIAQQARSDKTDVESRLTDLMLRQAQLEARQGMLLQIAGEGASAAPPTGAQPQPQRRGQAPMGTEEFSVLDSTVPPHDRLNRVEQSIVRLEAVYANAAENAAIQSRLQVNALSGVLAELGVDVSSIAPPRRPTGIPLPKSLTEGGSPFEAGLAQARRSIGDLGRLRQFANSMPFQRPVSAVRMSSPFGIRVHPIFRTERLHAGMDFAAAEGTPIRAAGSGIVQSVGWGGGYGNLLIIDHGNQVTTRYAHLNEFLVQQGQPVVAGQIVARSGNTGASTGPHLHYETRVKGEPKDPGAFLAVGDKLNPAGS